MHDVARRAHIVRSDPGPHVWELALRPPRADLRPYVRDICGYFERSPGAVRRFEYPGPQIVVIIEFGPPVRVYDAGQLRTSSRYPDGFVAGLDDRFTLVEHAGLQHGLQLNLTPIGGRIFFDRPMSDLTGQVVPLPDLVDRAERHLADRLASLPDWDARFDLVEDLLSARLEARRHPRVDMLLWAYRQIERSGGAVDVAALGRALGYSHRHVIALFREHVGVPPKLLARMVRFDRLVTHLRTGGEGTWADLALQFGYYDQSHLVRDVRQFTGTTPTQARASMGELSQVFVRDRESDAPAGPELGSGVGQTSSRLPTPT